MIGVNRGLYLQEETGIKTPEFEWIKSSLQQIVLKLMEAF